LRKWIEKIGIGTVKMITQCKDKGFEAPVWRTTENAITVTFPGISVPFYYNEGITDSLKESMLKIINELGITPPLASIHIAKAIEKPTTRTKI